MRKFVKMVLWVVTALVILVAIITGSNLLFFWSIFDWFQGLIVRLGPNPLLAKAIASLLLAVVVMLRLGKIVLSFTPLPQKNKNLYRALIFVSIGIYFSIAFLGNRNAFFDSKKGGALKYYSEVNGKTKFFTTPGFDPETGDSLLPVTKEVILRSKGIKPNKEVEQSNTQQAIPISSSENYPEAHITSSNRMMETVLTDSVNNREIATQIDTAKSDSDTSSSDSRNNFLTTTVEVSNVKAYSEQENVLSPPSRKPRTLAEILSGKIDNNENVEELRESEYTGPIGYSISIIDNPELENLGNIFKEEIEYIGYQRYSSCRTEFDNLSRGKFEFYNEDKSLIFRVPAKKKMVVVLEPGYYYFKADESYKLITLRLPDRAKFNIKISEVRDVPSGEILIGGISDF